MMKSIIQLKIIFIGNTSFKGSMIVAVNKTNSKNKINIQPFLSLFMSIKERIIKNVIIKFVRIT